MSAPKLRRRQAGELRGALEDQSPRAHRRFTGHAVAAIVKRTAAKAGLPVQELWHSLRAGFVTQTHEGGADISAIMDQTGHGLVATAFECVRRTNKWKKSASAKLGCEIIARSRPA